MCLLAWLQGLSKLLGDHAPSCMKEHKFDAYFGRKIAIDASMHIYQFMVRADIDHTPSTITALCEALSFLLRSLK